MSKPKTSIVFIVLGFSILSSFNVNANSLSLSKDINPLSHAEESQSSRSINTAISFSDIVNLSVTPLRDLMASISSVSSEAISFTTFNLYQGDSADLFSSVKSEEVFNSAHTPDLLAKVSFANVEETSLAGDYLFKITGSNLGSSSYRDVYTLASTVPEANAFAMMLAGLSLMGFVASRRKG